MAIWMVSQRIQQHLMAKCKRKKMSSEFSFSIECSYQPKSKSFLIKVPNIRVVCIKFEYSLYSSDFGTNLAHYRISSKAIKPNKYYNYDLITCFVNPSKRQELGGVSVFRLNAVVIHVIFTENYVNLVFLCESKPKSICFD